MKPIVQLIEGARWIWPEKGIRVTAGIGPSGAVSFARTILARYLGRGEYELDPAFLIFAQWANQQEEEVCRETRELKNQLRTLMKIVQENRWKHQLPSVTVQLLKRLEQTVFLCDHQLVFPSSELLTFCREIIREKNHVTEYLQKPEVSSRLWNLLSENGGVWAADTLITGNQGIALSGNITEQSWLPAVKALERQREKRIWLRMVSLEAERKAKAALQFKNYIQRFSEIKKESFQTLEAVLTRRQSVLELFEQLTPEEQRALEQLLPEYFPEGSNLEHVLTTMGMERWSAFRERLQVLTETEAPAALEGREGDLKNQIWQISGKLAFYKLLSQYPNIRTRLSPLGEGSLWLSEMDGFQWEAVRNDFLRLSSEAEIWQAQRSYLYMEQKLQDFMEWSVWRSEKSEKTAGIEFLDQKEARLVSELVQRLEEVSGELSGEVSEAFSGELPGKLPGEFSENLSEAIVNLGAQSFINEYKVRKERYLEQVRQEIGSLPVEMETMIGKAPLISMINGNRELWEYLTECLYEIPELNVYRAAAKEGGEPGEQEAEMAEVIASLDDKEWRMLENRLLQSTWKTHQNMVLEKVVEKTASERSVTEAKTAIEKRQTERLVSELVQRLEKVSGKLPGQLWGELSENQSEAIVNLGERSFIKEYKVRKERYLEQVRQEMGSLPVEMEAMIGKAPLISMINGNRKLWEYLTECLYEIPELNVYRAAAKEEGEPGEQEAEMAEVIASLDDKEWRMLENRLLQSTWETHQKIVLEKLVEKTRSEQSVTEVGNLVEKELARESGVQKQLESHVLKRIEETIQKTVERSDTEGEPVFLETIRGEAEEAMVFSVSPEKIPQEHAAERQEEAARDMTRARAVMMDSAITWKGKNTREILTQQNGMELCSYDFVMPDRVVVRPQPSGAAEPPETTKQGSIISEISPEEVRSLQTDIIKIQRPEQQRMKGEYEQKLQDLSERLKEQKEALERLQETQHQLSDPKQMQRMMNRMLKQLKSQVQLERLQRGAD